MKITPKKEEELNNFSLFNEGIYNFEVLSAEDTVSKSGNEMIKLKIRVSKPDYSTTIIFDYLLEAIAYKIRHFAYAIGIGELYEKGNIDAIHCIGKIGQLELGIQQGQPNPNGGYYQDKNIVKDYIAEVKEPVTIESDFIDCEIPF